MGVLSGKTCVVTGGAGSIGLAGASRFLDEGANVMLVGRNAKNLEAAAATLTAAGDRVAIDVLFSHAGISGVLAPVTEYPEDVFDGGSIIITSSIMGVTADPGVVAYATSKHALIGMARVVAKEAAARNIRVNVLAPGPTNNTFQTNIEEKLTQIVGQDGTEFLDHLIALGRHARPEEIAQMALFLASDRSSFSTGAVFMADGGMGI